MKIKAYIAFLLTAVLMTACSNIDEDERLTVIDRTVRIDARTVLMLPMKLRS